MEKSDLVRLNILQLELFGKMGLGFLENTTKWDVYKDKGVSVSVNGNQVCGIVKEINTFQGYVYLQPCLVMNSLATKLSIVKDIPATVPFNSNGIVPLYQPLKEVVKEFNEFKKAEQAKKGEQSK